MKRIRQAHERKDSGRLRLAQICGWALILTTTVLLVLALALGSCSSGAQQKALAKGQDLLELARSGSGLVPPWAMFGRNSLRTRLSEHTGPPTNRLKWKYTTTTDVNYSSPAIAADGTVYIGDSGAAGVAPKLYAIGANGRVKWTFAALGDLNPPAISADGNTIYVGGGGSEDNQIYAISSSGSLRWTYPTGGPIHASAGVVGEDGTVYMGSSDGKLYALNPGGPDAERLKWAFDTGNSYPTGGIWSSPAIGSDGTLYFGSLNDKFYAVNPAGTQKWVYLYGGGMSSPAVSPTDGTVYFGTGNNHTGTGNQVVALYPNGTLKWIYTTAYNVWSSPAIGADGTVYVGDYDTLTGSPTQSKGSLYAIYDNNADQVAHPNGTLRWTYSDPALTYNSGVLSSPALGADGTVYFATIGGWFYAVNPNGTKKWYYGGAHGPYGCASSPAIGGDGTVYFGGTAWVKKDGVGPGLFAFGPGLN